MFFMLMNLQTHKTAVVVTAILVSTLTPTVAQVAFTTDFTSAADYDDNFVKLGASGSANTVWSTNEYLSKSGSGSQSVIFDTSATGGSDGSGGTSGSFANNNYGTVSVGSKFRFGNSGPSMGYWARVNDSYTSGVLGLVNLTSTNARLRLFVSGNPLSTSVGSSIADQTFSTSVDFAEYYTGNFDVENVGSDLILTLSLYNASGDTLIGSVSQSTTNFSALTGQVGMRLSSNPLLVDSFTVVPEPSSASLAFVALAGIGLRWCLRRRQIARFPGS